jgi:CRISPR-associated protein Cas1
MADGHTKVQNDSEWATRSQHWISQSAKAQSKRGRRQRETAPLILTGHGLSIRVDRASLLIRDGNTHYPAERREWRFFKGGLDLPPRIVVLDGSGNVTLDALGWMAEQGVSFARVSYNGEQTAVMGPSGFSADPAKVAWQRETRDSPKKQLAFAQSIIRDKLQATSETLVDWLPPSPQRDKALTAVVACIAEVKKARTLSVLLSIEGTAAQNYWRAWRAVEMKWKAQSRYPVPDEWRTFQARSSVLSGAKWKNWRASNPINAMLNYAYAVLMTEMRIKAIADGYDPMFGIMHDQRERKKQYTPSFALDLMEPLRPVVDRAVLKLVAEETFSGADFLLRGDGVCSLNPQLARNIAKRVQAIDTRKDRSSAKRHGKYFHPATLGRSFAPLNSRA